MSQDQYLGADPEVYEEGGAYKVEPIPVLNLTERHTPQKTSCMTWQVPVFGIGQPLQVLQRRDRRFKAKIIINFSVPGTVTVNNNLGPLSVPQGYTITVPSAGIFAMPEWESECALYAIASVAGITMAILDESFAG